MWVHNTDWVESHWVIHNSGRSNPTRRYESLEIQLEVTNAIASDIVYDLPIHTLFRTELHRLRLPIHEIIEGMNVRVDRQPRPTKHDE